MTEEVRFPPDALDLAIQRIMPRYYANEGHGHIWPRPDGERFRCGATRLCDTCRADARVLDAARAEVARLAHLPTDLSDDSGERRRAIRAEHGLTSRDLGDRALASAIDRAMQQYAAGLQGEVERLSGAIQQALHCTPHICAGDDGYEIRYDCGDPFEILRTALGDTQ